MPFLPSLLPIPALRKKDFSPKALRTLPPWEWESGILVIRDLGLGRNLLVACSWCHPAGLWCKAWRKIHTGTSYIQHVSWCLFCLPQTWEHTRGSQVDNLKQLHRVSKYKDPMNWKQLYCVNFKTKSLTSVTSSGGSSPHVDIFHRVPGAVTGCGELCWEGLGTDLTLKGLRCSCRDLIRAHICLCTVQNFKKRNSIW